MLWLAAGAWMNASGSETGSEITSTQQITRSAPSEGVSRALWRQLRSHSGQSLAITVFAGSGLVVLSLHSLVDYPFRSMALACLGAVCAGLLLTPRLDSGPANDTPAPGKTR